MQFYRYPLCALGALFSLSIVNPVLASQLDPGSPLGHQSSSLTTTDRDLAQPLVSSAKSDDPAQAIAPAKIFPASSPTIAQVPSLPPSPPSGSGVMVPQPEIIIRSNGTANPDILRTNAPIAPELPRAIAPPVGDMAISNINAAPVPIDLGSKAIVPRLVLRKAPAKEVLAILARYAGLNLILDDSDNEIAPNQAEGQINKVAGQPNKEGGEPTISLDLQNEPVGRIFNSVLLISGLQAIRQGNTIFVGKRLNSNIRNLITRTIRLNQAIAADAASFLALQGAVTNIYIASTIRRTIDKDTREITEATTEPKIIPLEVDKSRGASGTNLLTGLQVSSDPRLNLITMVGEPRLVQIATSLLTQIDARRRQVALNVKIVDVNLNNIQDYNSSFSFGINDSFFIQDKGAAIMRFGSTSPVRQSDINSASGRVLNPPAVANPLSNANTFINTNDQITVPNYVPGGTFIDQVTGTLTQLPSTAATFFGRIAGVSTNPTLAGITDLTQGTPDVFIRTLNADGTISTTITRGTLPTATAGLPSYFQYPQKFQALIDAQIRSGTAKILTDPTIVVQESQTATVNLTQKVVSSVNSQVDPLSGVRTTTPVFSDVGLTLSVNVDRIDDNGFVSVKVLPRIAAPGSQQTFESGVGSVNTITLINSRELSSGLVRLRDGQTMILTGIISETDQSTVSKVPILGDIPILGALFRSSSDQKNRTEVIILLTPQIIDDNSQSQFGYNYSPGREAAGVLRDKGFPVQVQP